MNKKVVVTGATGFVGSAVVARLAKSDNITTIAAVRSPHLWQGQTMAVGYDLLGDELPDLTDVDAVIHCAARVHVMTDTSNDSLHAYRAANRDATKRLARHAMEAGVRRFVFISTIKVNGETTQGRGPFTVRDTPAPQDPYGQTKLEAEQALMALAATSSMDIVIIRPPLVYGPGVKANFKAMMKALDQGWPLPFGALHNRRSMVAVENLADLTVHCLDAPDAVGVVMARDKEQPTTSELMEALAHALGRTPRLIPVPTSWLRFAASALGKSGLATRLCDSLEVELDETTTRLNWHPPMTLQTCLRNTAQAYRKEQL